MMKFKKHYLLILAFFSIFPALLFAEPGGDGHSNQSAVAENPEDANRYYNLFMKSLHLFKHRYVDKDKTTYKNLIYGAIKGMVQAVDDPHTAFLNKKRVEKLMTETKGNYEGIGAHIRVTDGKLIILSPIEGSPAWETGLKSGDHVIEIEGESTKGITIEEAVSKLKGPKGTTVSIKVERDLIPRPLEFTIVRDSIKLKSVGYGMVTNDFKTASIGYIKIRNFSASTSSELKDALTDLKGQGAQNMILDLRNNPGGLLQAAFETADLFIDKGKIVYTKDRDGNVMGEFNASAGVTLPSYIPMIVLINRYSASASEILSGALQDHKRAVLVGEKTFGKFSVQNVFDLDPEDRTAVKLTIAYYYLPSGRSLHHEGIDPDIEIKPEAYTPYQRKMITKAVNSGLLEEWEISHENEKPKDRNIDDIKRKLDANDIDLPVSIIKRLLKNRLLAEKMPPLFDISEDIQLRRACEILTAGMIFSK